MQSGIGISVGLPGAGEILQVLTLQAGFNSAVVVLGTTFLGVASGLIGTFALLRKRSLVGDALAHCALPGLGAAYIVATLFGFEGRTLPLLLLGALVSGGIGVLTVEVLSARTRLGEDTAVGAVLSVFFGAGVVLLSVIQSLGTGSEGGLHRFIYGQTAALQRGDALLLGGLAIVAVLFATLLQKEFQVVCFDPQFARVQGWPVERIDLVLMGSIALVTVIGLQAVGLLLIVALLIMPPAAARFWTERLGRMVVLAGVIGGVSGYIGSSASSLLPRLPAGAVIVLTAGIVFFFSLLFAPRRGVVAAAFRRWRFDQRVQREHFLRNAYEELEERGGEGELPLSRLSLIRRFSPVRRALFLRILEGQGLIARLDSATIAFTPKGRTVAREMARNHRLWEQYVLNFGGVIPTHVDYSADIAEHVLSPDIVRELEEALRRRGIVSNHNEDHPSVHRLPT